MQKLHPLAHPSPSMLRHIETTTETLLAFLQTNTQFCLPPRLLETHDGRMPHHSTAQAIFSSHISKSFEDVTSGPLLVSAFGPMDQGYGSGASIHHHTPPPSYLSCGRTSHSTLPKWGFPSLLSSRCIR